MAFALATAQSFGDGISQFDCGDLPGRVYTNYEGRYTFSDASVLSIQGFGDIHVLKYKCPDHEGVVLVFARITSDGKAMVLRECGPNTKGVTPSLDGVDVFPGTNEAEIIVRWRHPGQGGLRSIEKYRYSSSRIEYVAGSDFVSEGRKMKWVKAGYSATSTPATYSPGPASLPSE